MFGKRKSKEILLECPSCTHQQNEPRHALSTFCRKCGEHYRIKDGHAVQSAGASLSGLTSFRELGEVEVVSNAPIDRHNRAIDALPASKKEKIEFETPVSEEKSVPGTSETDVAETGAETWLETTRKTTHESTPEVAEETPELEREPEVPEKEEPPAPEPPKSKKEKKVRKKKSPKSKRGKKETKTSTATAEEEKPKPEKAVIEEEDDYEESNTNPIALAAAVAAKKNQAVHDLELAQAKKFTESKLGAESQPKQSLSEGSMAALLQGVSTDEDIEITTDPKADQVKVEAEPAHAKKEERVELNPAKMPKDFADPSKKSKNLNVRPIRCFKCNHRQMVSLSASSTQCGRCSVYISLSDYDIKSSQAQTIRTRGNVIIHRRGSLMGCDIACHDLTVLGKISGSVDCSGNATFKNSGKVMGSMHCKHLQVDKKCELTFPQGVIAESADISGIVNGDITCSGTVKINKTGAVNGDAKAKAIVLKDGGILSGQMSIQHDVDIELPLKRGYDPSIID